MVQVDCGAWKVRFTNQEVDSESIDGEEEARDTKAEMGGSVRTSGITTQHQVQCEITIIVILEGIAKVDDERMVDL